MQELSKETFRKFREDPSCASAEKEAGISFECHIVAAGIWPFSTKQTLAEGNQTSNTNDVDESIIKGPLLPPQMTLLQNAYTNFYNSIQKGIKLLDVDMLMSFHV